MIQFIVNSSQTKSTTLAYYLNLNEENDEIDIWKQQHTLVLYQGYKPNPENSNRVISFHTSISILGKLKILEKTEIER